MKALIGSLLLLLATSANAQSCYGHFINPLTDICWSCLFPLTLGSQSVWSSNHLPDTTNPKMPVCQCSGNPLPRVGLAIGFWEPAYLVDVTRSPFCLVNLGGLNLTISPYYHRGAVAADSHLATQSFYHVHWYHFPLLYWLNLLTDGLCVERGEFDIAYLSELDVLWNDDELSFIINPEAALFGQLATQAACAVDTSQALVSHANDKLFWCAGAQGSIYPLTGHVQEHVGGVQASLLLATRINYKLHRLHALKDSSAKSLCRQDYQAMLPKSRYRYQLVNPRPTPEACYPLGRATSIWEAGHEYPFKGEDFGYLWWRKRNCCAF